MAHRPAPARLRQNPHRRRRRRGAHARQVFGRVDADAGRAVADVHGDALAVPEHAQLLERLDLLERAVREPRKAAQEAGPVGVEADVAQRRRRRRRGPPAAGVVAPPRESARARSRARGRAASSTTLTMFGLSKSARVCRSRAPPCSSRSRGARRAGSAQASISAGSISGSSPCTLTTISSSPSRPSSAQASARRSLPLAWSARVSTAATPWRGAGGDDVGVVGRDDDARARRQRGALRDAHDHRQAADVGQRLARQARRRQPRRNQDGEGHAAQAAGRRRRSARSRGRAGALRLRASPGCRRAPETPGRRRCRPAPGAPAAAAASAAAALCRSGRRAGQAGGFPCGRRWWPVAAVGGAAAAARAAPRRTPARERSLAAPPRRACRDAATAAA